MVIFEIRSFSMEGQPMPSAVGPVVVISIGKDGISPNVVCIYGSTSGNGFIDKVYNMVKKVYIK